MKTPIEPNDIRKGDLIRWESVANPGYAIEWRASGDHDRRSDGTHHYLLERPAPAVKLPNVPTLGWLSVANTEPMLGRWRSYEPNFRRDDGREYKSVLQDERDIDRGRVTAFTEAVAVPTEALETLRKAHVVAGVTGAVKDAYSSRMVGMRDFLAAVDEANGDA